MLLTIGIMKCSKTLIEFNSGPAEFKIISTDCFGASIVEIEFCCNSKNLENNDE